MSRVTGPFYCYPHLNLSRLQLLSALSDQVQCYFLRPPGLPPSIWCYSLLNLLLPLTSSGAVLHLIHFCPPPHLNKLGGIPLLPSTVSNQAGGHSTPLSTSSDQVRRCSTIVLCPIRSSPTATLYLIWSSQNIQLDLRVSWDISVSFCMFCFVLFFVFTLMIIVIF